MYKSTERLTRSGRCLPTECLGRYRLRHPSGGRHCEASRYFRLCSSPTGHGAVNGHRRESVPRASARPAGSRTHGVRDAVLDSVDLFEVLREHPQRPHLAFERRRRNVRAAHLGVLVDVRPIPTLRIIALELFIKDVEDGCGELGLVARCVVTLDRFVDEGNAVGRGSLSIGSSGRRRLGDMILLSRAPHF